jgi:hypothetical protein
MVQSRIWSLAALTGGLLLCLTGRTASAAVYNVTPAQLRDTILSPTVVDGDTINVSAGTTKDYIVVTKSLNIRGAQADVPGSAPTRGGTETVLCSGIEIVASDVTINGLCLKGATNKGHPGGWGAWVLKHTSNVTFINNVVQNNVFGLYLNGTGHTVQYNLFRNNNKSGAASGDGIYSDFGLHEAVISNNSFTGHTAGSIVVLGGVKGGTVTDLTINCNQIVDDGTLALIGCSDVTITNNVICGIQNGHGILLGGGNARVSIQGNDILASKHRGIRVEANTKKGINSDIRIFENNIANNVKGGLSVVPGSYSDGDNLIDQLGDDNKVDARCNSWGALDGPQPKGSGNKVSGDAVYKPFRKYMDITKHVDVKLLQTYSNVGTGIYLQVIRITNNSPKAIIGEALYVLGGFAANNINWTNANGNLDDQCQAWHGSPKLDFVTSGNKLLPGQSLVLTLQFNTTPGGPFDTTKIGGTDGTLLNPIGRVVLAANFK